MCSVHNIRTRNQNQFELCVCIDIITLENALLGSTETHSAKWWNRMEYSGKYSGIIHYSLFIIHSAQSMLLFYFSELSS